jgi:LPS-assembly lipoprotein
MGIRQLLRARCAAATHPAMGHGSVSRARAAALGLCLAWLAGCGFHLQGAMELPAANRHIYLYTADEITPFAIELRRAIERAGGSMAPTASAAGTVVRITRDRSGRRVLSVSARNTPQEYEVYYAVEYTVDRAGQEILETQPLELTRNMSFDETQVLAKDREEAILLEAMARDLATLVLRRIGSI